MRTWFVALLGLLLIAGPAKTQDLTDYVSRGDYYFHNQDYQAAERQFAQAVKAFPKAPIPRLARGHTLFAMRRYEAASRSLQEGIHLLPAWNRSGINLREFFRHGAEFDGNLANLVARVNAAPKDRDLVFLLAYCLHFSGRRQRAQVLFQYLLKLSPEHEAARTFVVGPKQRKT